MEKQDKEHTKARLIEEASNWLDENREKIEAGGDGDLADLVARLLGLCSRATA